MPLIRKRGHRGEVLRELARMHGIRLDYLSSGR